MKVVRLLFVFFALIEVLPSEVLPSEERAIYATLKEELTVLVDGPGDVWAYSGDGGYVFKFEMDVIGSEAKELFLNFSLRPNDWHIYTENGEGRSIGNLQFVSFDFVHAPKKDGSTRILKAHSADSYAEPPLEPFEKYIFEKIISEAGVEAKVRKVGGDATEDDFNNLMSGNPPAGYTWARPIVRFMALRDFLLEEDAKWMELNHDEIEIRHGYYRISGDDNRAFNSTFSPTVALEVVNKTLGVIETSETENAIPSEQPSAPPEIAQLQEQASPPPTGSEAKSLSPISSMIALVAILAVVLGTLIFILRRK